MQGSGNFIFEQAPPGDSYAPESLENHPDNTHELVKVYFLLLWASYLSFPMNVIVIGECLNEIL